ncbi:unnamed protein product [Plutella xylostella]|uniref:(diamondback moth) hypothetical protein n=1 Tax=Plutella xylostella TaxID=51655 RepID=A0A8S4FMT8_PLUXY|nr:unnamed protein product [Plutella xylostella]
MSGPKLGGSKRAMRLTVASALSIWILGSGSKRATRLTVATALGIWILAALFATPAYVGSYIRVFVVNPTTQFLACYPYPVEWGDDYPRLVVLVRFVVYYSLPLAVIAVFYILMARHLVLSTQNMPGELQGTVRQMRARRKVALTVLAFVLVFAACFLPSHVFMMWFYYCDNNKKMKKSTRPLNQT